MAPLINWVYLWLTKLYTIKNVFMIKKEFYIYKICKVTKVYKVYKSH